MRQLFFVLTAVVLLASAAPVSAADETAVATLRQRLTERGYPPELALGPMAALYPDELGGSDAPTTLNPLPTGGVPVLTVDGVWWVWEHGDRAPAPQDALAHLVGCTCGS